MWVASRALFSEVGLDVVQLEAVGIIIGLLLSVVKDLVQFATVTESC